MDKHQNIDEHFGSINQRTRHLHEQELLWDAGKMEKFSQNFLESSEKSNKVNLKSITESFPWIQHFNTKMRFIVKADNSETVVISLLKQYKQLIRADMQTCIRLPNRCFLLSKNVIRTILIFKLLNKQFVDAHDYLNEICDLLSIYTTLELRYSTKFEETKICAANRIALNYEAHLRSADEKCILQVLMAISNFYQQREIMRKLYGKYLKGDSENTIPRELGDDMYIMYLISFKQWKSLEDNLQERLKIEEIANSFMRPGGTLRKNPLYAPYLPVYKAKHENATKYILSQNFCVDSLKMAFKNQGHRGNDASTIIDLIEESESSAIQDTIQPNILFPQVKFEVPQIIGTVDITSNIDYLQSEDLHWLESLIDKARQFKKIEDLQNIIEIIDLDEIDTSQDNFNSEESVNDITILPQDNKTVTDVPSNDNNANQLEFPREEIEKSHDNHERPCQIDFEPPHNFPKQNSYKSFLKMHNNLERFLMDDEESSLNENDTSEQDSLDQLQSILVPVKPKKKFQDTQDNEKNISQEILSNKTTTNSLAAQNCASISEKYSFNALLDEKQTVHTCQVSLKNSACNNTVAGKKIYNDTNEKDNGRSRNDIFTDRFISNCDEIEAWNSKTILNTKEDKIKQGSIKENENDIDEFELSPNLVDQEYLKKGSTSSLDNFPGTDERNKHSSEREISKEKCATTNTNFTDNLTAFNSLRSQEKLIQEEINECKAINQALILRTYSKRCRKSKQPSDLESSLESYPSKIACNNETNIPSHHPVDVEVKIQQTGGQKDERLEEQLKTNEKNISIQHRDSGADQCPQIIAEMNTDIGITSSKVINNKNRLKNQTKINEDDADDDIIKNIVRQLTPNTEKAATKKKKDQFNSIESETTDTSESISFDLPTFSSSSEESHDSNILSILEESDNSQEHNTFSNTAQDKQDDTPVSKISSKTDDGMLKCCKEIDVIMKIKNDDLQNALKPSEIECHASKSQPNVIFSTSKSNMKSLQSNWTDPIANIDEQFFQSHPGEISSPPIEEFTKSDKTLFQTLLNKVNDNTLQTNIKNNNETVLISLNDCRSSNGKNLKQHSDVLKTNSPSFSSKDDLNELLSSTPKLPRQKTVSFIDVQNDKHKNVIPCGIQSTSKKNLSGKECWVASINTYRSNHQTKNTQTSCQPNVSTINMNYQQKASTFFEPDAYMDEKLFNAYVYLKRIDDLLVLKNKAISKSTANKDKTNVVNLKLRNAYHQKYLNSFESKLVKSSLHGSNRNYARGRIKDQKTFVNFNRNSIQLKDIKLAKKLVVLLNDIRKGNKFNHYFPQKIVSNRKSHSGRTNDQINILNNNTPESQRRDEQHSKKDFSKYIYGKRLKITRNKWNRHIKRNYVVISNTKASTQNSTEGTKRMKIYQSDENFRDEKDISVHDITSSDLCKTTIAAGINTQQTNIRQGSNKFQQLGYCINSYNKPSQTKCILVSLRTTSLGVHDSSKCVTPLNGNTTSQSNRWNQEDCEDHQVSSTQDYHEQANEFRLPSTAVTIDEAIQNNYVDTTLKESASRSDLMNTLNSKAITNISKSDIPEIPSTTSLWTNDDLQEIGRIPYHQIETGYACRSNDTCTTTPILPSAIQQTSNNVNNMINQSTNLTEHNNTDATKTYSNMSFFKTIFVPPEIEKIIEDQQTS